eukprot:1532214-Alexandrium_andersonii.AAC.1
MGRREAVGSSDTNGGKLLGQQEVVTRTPGSSRSTCAWGRGVQEAAGKCQEVVGSARNLLQVVMHRDGTCSLEHVRAHVCWGVQGGRRRKEGAEATTGSCWKHREVATQMVGCVRGFCTEH